MCDYRVVEIERGVGGSFGFSVIGGIDTELPPMVCALVHNGSAQLSGKTGFQIGLSGFFGIWYMFGIDCSLLCFYLLVATSLLADVPPEKVDNSLEKFLDKPHRDI